MKRNNRGFTLVEMMVVTGVIATILSIATPMMIRYADRARATACLSLRYYTERAESAYIIEKNAPSPSFSALIGLGLLAQEPACPSGGTYVWIQQTPTPILGCSLHYAIVPVGDTANVLFSSAFDTMNHLRSLMGKWNNVTNGALVNTPGNESRIAFGDNSWTDYEIKTSAVLTKGSGYGIYYRADGNPNITGYVFQYDPGDGNKFAVRKVIGGQEQSPFQTASMPQGFPIYNQAHDISIAVVGNRTVIKVDGQTIMDFTDSSFASGSGGFRTWGSSAAAFDNLSVVKK
jgi:prepilin-type N-terminal cleavage/methylation domain-containing protein